MNEKYGNFPFSQDIILKQSYRYIYIAIFGKYLWKFYWIVLMCF